MGKAMCVAVLAFGLLAAIACPALVLAQSTQFEAEMAHLHQQAVKDREALGLQLLDPKLDELYPYSQVAEVSVQEYEPGASAALALSGTFPPGVAVLSDRDGAVLSDATLSPTSYSARITMGASESPGYVKLWFITPVHHVWTVVPVLFIDTVFQFELSSNEGYSIRATPTATSFTLEERAARLPYKTEFFRSGESVPFEVRDGLMSYHPDQDTQTMLEIEIPEPDLPAAQEMEGIMQQMNDPNLTDAQRSDLTVKMVQAQQRMMEEMMGSDPAAAQKKIDDFGCKRIQVYRGKDGAVEGGIDCGKNFIAGGRLVVTGTISRVN